MNHSPNKQNALSGLVNRNAAEILNMGSGESVVPYQEMDCQTSFSTV